MSDKYFEIGNSAKWCPSRDLLNAFKNIHEGKIPAPMNEASFVTLNHEVQHTNQKWSLASALKLEYRGTLTVSQHNLEETVNELTNRDKYSEVLKELGRDAIYSERMKKDSFIYPHMVNNFYALFVRLGIKGEALEKLRADLSEINKTKELASFSVEVSMLLQKSANIDPGKELRKPLLLILDNLDDPKFDKEYLE